MSVEDQYGDYDREDSFDNNLLGKDDVSQRKRNQEKERVLNLIRHTNIDNIIIKPPISIQSLFSSRFRWKIINAFHLFSYSIFCALGILSIILSIYSHFYLYKMWHLVDQEINRNDVPSDSVVLFCATILPIIRYNIKEFIGVPYASLPLTNFHFNKPRPLLTFVDCYNSYWVNLELDQKRFDNGRLYFFSTLPYRNCKQISENSLEIDGIDSCLTINIKLPSERPGFFGRKIKNHLPVVIVLTGRTFLRNKPFQVGDSILKEINALFITINFRLGVLGFANFDFMKSPPNVGIIDVLKAMEFIYNNIEKFGGDKNNITLLAEESGATTGILYMLMKKTNQWFSKIWLIDGSTFVPDLPIRSPFYDLYSSSQISCNIFPEIEDIFNCLQNHTSETLLNNTPIDWLQADKYFNKLPNIFESRESLVEKQDNFILSPLESVMKAGSDIDDIPTVIMSKIDYMPYFERASLFKNYKLTKSDLFTKTRLGLLTYQTGISQVAINKEINTAYNEYIKFVENKSIHDQNVDKDIVPLGFEVVFQAIISDLRVVCPYNAIAKYLQVNTHIVNSPIYRIIDGGYRFTVPPMKSGSLCDLNFFLQDELSECKSDSKDIPGVYKETLLKSLKSFVMFGKIDEIQKMNYPTNSSMKEFEDTFTFVGRLGFRTPGVREIGMLQACNLWKKGTDELPMLKTSAKVN